MCGCVCVVVVCVGGSSVRRCSGCAVSDGRRGAAHVAQRRPPPPLQSRRLSPPHLQLWHRQLGPLPHTLPHLQLWHRQLAPPPPTITAHARTHTLRRPRNPGPRRLPGCGQGAGRGGHEPGSRGCLPGVCVFVCVWGGGAGLSPLALAAPTGLAPLGQRPPGWRAGEPAAPAEGGTQPPWAAETKKLTYFPLASPN